MEELLAHLAEKGLTPSGLLPDGVLHRFGDDERQWAIAFQRHRPKSGEVFFYVSYGHWGQLLPGFFCTLQKPSPQERVIIKACAKEAEKAELKAFTELLAATEGIEREVLRGAATAAPVLAVAPPVGAVLYPLGFKGESYFFTSSENQQIVELSAFSKKDFFHLLGCDYWEAMYPGGGASPIDWNVAMTDLMRQCRARGIFETRRVRGTGVWEDDGRTVVNLGDHLCVARGSFSEGLESIALRDFKTRYFYTLGAKLRDLSPDPLQLEDCATLIHACNKVRWKKESSGFLLAGWLVLARICGALPVRPHLWITAAIGEGKSTIHDQLVKPILGESTEDVMGSTTEAYVRQTLCDRAVPLLFNEFEAHDPKTLEKIQSVLALMRAAWDNSGTGIGRGGAGGVPQIFYPRFIAMVFSVQTSLIQKADESRFAKLELAAHEQFADKAEHYAELIALLNKIDNEYGERLFARAVRHLPRILANFKTIKTALARVGTSRFADQYGMLLAGYSVLVNDMNLTEDEAAWYVSQVPLDEELEQAKEKDQQTTLETVLTTKIRFTVADTSGRESPVEMHTGEAIQAARRDPQIDTALQRVGIRVGSHGVGFAGNTHAEMEKTYFRGTRWSKSWTESLARLPGAERGQVQRLLGFPTRLVNVPWSTLGIDP